MSKDIWEHYWVAEQPIFKHYTQTLALTKHRGVIGNTAHQFLIYSIHGEAHCYYTKESYRRVQIDGKKLLNSKVAVKITKNIELDIKKFWKIEKRLRAPLIKKEDVHSQKFINLFKEFNTLVVKIFAYFRTTWEATSFFSEEELKKILKLNYADSWEDKIIPLITATKNDLLIKEKISWLKVLKNPTKKEISQHMLSFPFLFGNIELEDDAFKIMHKRIKNDSVTALQKEINISEKRLQKIKIEQNKIFGEINFSEAKNIASLLQKFSLLRLELKNCWQGIHFYLFPLFNEIAHRTNLSIKDIMIYWTFKDIENFLQKKIAVTESEMQNRRYFYLLLLDKGKFNFYSGKKAEKIKKGILDKSLPKIINEFRGQIANRGFVRGKVKIIKFDDLRIIEKVAEATKGKFILVTGMTNPNMIPLIKKAKAIVTDEGGMTCHAAIISREFNVPCIVGTRVATSVLKDDDFVEVDANKGIVKIIKRGK